MAKYTQVNRPHPYPERFPAQKVRERGKSQSNDAAEQHERDLARVERQHEKVEGDANET
jgi:hypothetical protein